MIAQPPVWTLSYIGIPFIDRGRDLDGCDCWGLVRLVMQDRVQVTLDSLQVSESDYQSVMAEIASAQQTSEWISVDQDCECTFDVAEMSWPVRINGQWRHEPLHVGIIVAPGWLLHTERSTAAMLSPYTSDLRIKRRIIGFWRHRELSTRAV